MYISFIHLLIHSNLFYYFICVSVICHGGSKKIEMTSRVMAVWEVGFFTCHMEPTTSLRLTKVWEALCLRKRTQNGNESPAMTINLNGTSEYHHYFPFVPFINFLPLRLHVSPWTSVLTYALYGFNVSCSINHIFNSASRKGTGMQFFISTIILQYPVPDPALIFSFITLTFCWQVVVACPAKPSRYNKWKRM